MGGTYTARGQAAGDAGDGLEGSAAKIADDKGREDEGANAACNLAVRPTLQPQPQPLEDSIH